VQLSATVHTFVSSQLEPFGLSGCEQTPFWGSQVPARWQLLRGVHTTGLAPTHAPLEHESVWVQASPSVHGVPLGFGSVVHTPLAGLQVPWHDSGPEHTIGSIPVHTPLRHSSVCVHASLSLQDEPFGTGGSEHTPVDGLHVPTW